MSNVLKKHRILDSGNTQNSPSGDTYWEIQDLDGNSLTNIDNTFNTNFVVLKQDTDNDLLAYIAVIGDTDTIVLNVQNAGENASIYLQLDGTVRIDFTNTIVASQFPEYIDDAAADADSLLVSGSLYKITGDRSIYQKP